MIHLPARDYGNMNILTQKGKKNGLGNGFFVRHMFSFPIAAVTNYHELCA